MNQINPQAEAPKSDAPNLPIVAPNSPSHPEQKQNGDAPGGPQGECQKPTGNAKRGYWKSLWNEKPDRHIELFLAITIAFFAASQCITSCRTFNATSRPYVGINNIPIAHHGIDGSGKSFTTGFPTKDTKEMAFDIEIKNFGTVPGTGFKTRWEVLINGVRQPGSGLPEEGESTIFPSGSVYLSATIGDREYPKIMSGASALQIRFQTDYKGPAGAYKYCGKYQYSNETNAFLNLGSECPRP